LFISYAHDDREKWLPLIVRHLRSAQTLGLIDIFEDGAIKPGEAWSPRVQRELESAAIVVLIVTPLFVPRCTASGSSWSGRFSVECRSSRS
jgi:hypothetical protein